MEMKTLLNIILSIIFCFSLCACDDFNLWAGAMRDMVPVTEIETLFAPDEDREGINQGAAYIFDIKQD